MDRSRKFLVIFCKIKEFYISFYWPTGPKSLQGCRPDAILGGLRPFQTLLLVYVV